MDFKQLKSFVTVVKCGSFTIAASKLGVSQPTISTHLRMLEEELGQPLVRRNAKRVRLTEGGSKVYEQALAILAMHDRLLNSVVGREGEAIYLGASSIPACYILPPALSAYKHDHPGARFSIHQTASRDIVDGVSDGAFDVGFTGMTVTDDSVESIPFCGDRIVLITPNSDDFASLSNEEPLDIVPILREAEIIMRDIGSGTRAEASRVLQEAGIDEDELDVVASLNDLSTVNNLVENGLGVSLVSYRSVRDRVRDGRLLAFDVANANTSRIFYMLRRKNATISESAQHFIAFMRLYHGDELMSII